MSFSFPALAVLGLAAFITGMSKTGIPGLGIVGVVLAPMVIPAKVSTGYILPFLIFADVMAVLYWRGAAQWRHILAILPATAVGITVGWLCMDRIDDAVYGKVLGGIVLGILCLDWLRRRYALPISTSSRPFAWIMGFLAGLMTMLANAAGPVMMIYLLAMNLSKEQFVGTTAWLYFIINLTKVPFSVNLGLISPDSFQLNVLMLPLVIAGGVIGIFIMRRIPQQSFNSLMRLLAFAGGVNLLF